VLIAPGFIESEIRQVNNAGEFRGDAEDVVPRWIQMPTDKAAAEIVDAIARRERERVLTLHGKAAAALQRYAPGAVAALLGLGAKRRR
jgi:short-subunit dehydrogenase